jgi:hypothetical protein
MIMQRIDANAFESLTDFLFVAPGADVIGTQGVKLDEESVPTTKDV